MKSDLTTFADLALINGNIVTMNPAHPHAAAVAIKDGKIVKVGTNEEISKFMGQDTKVICLNGKTVVPGFIDVHVHVASFGRLLTWIELDNVRSIPEMLCLLRKRVEDTPKGKWIIGRGWDQTRFLEQRLPTRFDLDLVSPDNPVVFYHIVGQMCVVNTKALEVVGITGQTSAPLGGVIDKDEESGHLTGILRGSAASLVWKAIPELGEEELVEATEMACRRIIEAGVTSVHWIVLSSLEILVMQKLLEKKKLPLRVYIIVPLSLVEYITNFRFIDNLSLRIGGVLVFADGYLAAKTAALFQPYNDGSGASGNLLCTINEMKASATKIIEMKFQLIIHAMGDKAVDAALTTVEQVLREMPRRSRRIRFEHAAVLSEDLVRRIKKQRVIVSVQPLVIDSEFSTWLAIEHLGIERARWLYPLKTLIRNGIVVIGGSDCPMEPLNPLRGIQAAVTRSVFSEEQITVEEALQMYTINAAYSTHEENLKGSIESGKLADLTVLSQDPRKVLPSEIQNITVEMTIIGGKIAYSKL